MTLSRIAVGLLCLALAAPGAANAGLITWELEGTIELVAPTAPVGEVGFPDPDLILPQLTAAGVTNGVDWRARVTYDSDTPPDLTYADQGLVRFDEATKWIYFAAGGISAETPVGAVGPADTFVYAEGGSTVHSVGFGAPMANESPALVAEVAGFVLVSEDPAVQFTTSLPTEPPSLSSLRGPIPPSGGWLATRFVFFGHGFAPGDDPSSPGLVPQGFRIEGRITSLTRVPEPATFALVLVAGAAIALRRR